MCITEQQVTKAAQHRAERRVMRYVASHMGNMMRITEGQLRHIIRDELNEMGMNPHAAALKARIGSFRSMSDAAYNESISLAIEEGDLDARMWQRALKSKRGNIALAFEEILSMLDEEIAGKIQQNYDDALEARQAEAETAGETEVHENEPRVGGNANLKQDIYGKLEEFGPMFAAQIVMSLARGNRREAWSMERAILNALSELTAGKHISQDERGRYHIPTRPSFDMDEDL